jgi:holo-[acyl-carrier protein] synthase
VGIDIVETGRLSQLLLSTPGLQATIFHPGEIAYAMSRASPDQHLAARHCAKEAVHKALGMAAFDPLDVEVVGGGDEKTHVRLHGAAERRAQELGVEVIISMSHLEEVATAIALATPIAVDDG